MAPQYLLRFKGLEARRVGSPGSASVTFDVFEISDSREEKWVAAFSLAVENGGEGMDRMVATAADFLAQSFRTLADQAHNLAYHYGKR